MKDNKLSYVILVLVGLLLGFGVFIFLNEPETYVENNYVYSNGQELFNVTVVSANESYVQLYVGDDETPYLIAVAQYGC